LSNDLGGRIDFPPINFPVARNAKNRETTRYRQMIRKLSKYSFLFNAKIIIVVFRAAFYTFKNQGNRPFIN
jgi:hypothetical protein